MRRPHAVFHWRDNNGGRAENLIYFAGSTDYGAIAAKAAALAPLLEAVSSARLVRYELRFELPWQAAAPAAPDSNARSYTLLFYRNNDRVASIKVPSAGRLPYQVSGPYAGVRVTREDLAVSGLLDTVEGLAAGLVDRLGRPYPTTFSVGGRVEL